MDFHLLPFFPNQPSFTANVNALAVKTEAKFGQWGILELMGHVRLGGFVTEETLFGTALGRIDIPGPNGARTTQYFGGSSIYRLTPTTEELATAVALHGQPEPVHRWEMPGAAQRRIENDYGDDE